jgi:peptidoglycan/xylan/chitin deacetylase (PgdA/CDA1 family)
MIPVSIICSTSMTGSVLRGRIADARAMAAVAGAPCIVISRSKRIPAELRAGDDALWIIHLPGAGADEALAAGLSAARTSHCLLADDDLHLSVDVMRLHRVAARCDAVTIAPIRSGRPDLVRSADPVASFSLNRGRDVCAPRDALSAASARHGLGDAVRARRVALDLVASGLSLELLKACAPSPAPPALHRLGRAATELYGADATTLLASGLGAYRGGSLSERVRRRILRRVPVLVLSRLAGTGLAGSARDAAFWRGVRAAVDRDTWGRITGATTILMYHAFTDDDQEGSGYIVPRAAFVRHLRLLGLFRRNVISLDAYVAARAAHRLPPARAVIITADDGYDDVYTVAAPELTAHGFPATVFVVSGRVGLSNDWDATGPLRGRPIADWDRLRAGVKDGIAVGAHTRSHRALRSVSEVVATEEIAMSREDLTHGLGHAITTFAYPHGDEDEATHRLAAKAGFAAACSCRGGKNSHDEPIMCLRRVEIRGNDPLWHVAVAICAGRRGYLLLRPIVAAWSDRWSVLCWRFRKF